VVEAVIEACRGEIEAKRHRLRTVMPPEPVELDVDRERVVQILCNLLGNAAKYTPAGGDIDLRVAVAPPDTLEVSVKDNGVGIPHDKLGEIFDLFARVEHSLERQDGLGIGLTLVRQLVELHGGTIEARSDGSGRGSEFVLSFPLLAATAEANAETIVVKQAGATRRVLIADDNKDAAHSLALLLQTLGQNVDVVHSGADALARAAVLRPDVMLLDLGMPGMTGYEVARRIRSESWGRKPLMVAITGWGQDEDRRRSREAGFDQHLVKPVMLDALCRVLVQAPTH